MRILITGVAGFVGYNLVEKFSLDHNSKILGLDNLNKYYSQSLKKKRLSNLKKLKNFKFIKLDLLNIKKLKKILNNFKPNIIIHLAAQPGVRYSFTDPDSYINSNILGFYNIISASKKIKQLKLFFYASSSSVYSSNKKKFSENEKIYNPNSLYGLTKKFNEDLAEYFSNYVSFKFVGLRFFSLYGPWGRPDMAYFNFTNLLYQRKTLKVFNYGNNKRDMTFIDDAVQSIKKLTLIKNFKEKHTILNIGNEKPVSTNNLIKVISSVSKIKPKYKMVGKLHYENLSSFAEIKKLKNIIGPVPKTDIQIGIKKFHLWFKNYFNIKNKK